MNNPDNGIKLLHWLGLGNTMYLVELSWYQTRLNEVPHLYAVNNRKAK